MITPRKSHRAQYKKNPEIGTHKIRQVVASTENVVETKILNHLVDLSRTIHKGNIIYLCHFFTLTSPPIALDRGAPPPSRRCQAS